MLTSGGYSFDISYTANAATLSPVGGNSILIYDFTPAPEPHCVLAIAAAVCAFGYVLRRCRRRFARAALAVLSH